MQLVISIKLQLLFFKCKTQLSVSLPFVASQTRIKLSRYDVTNPQSSRFLAFGTASNLASYCKDSG